MCYNACNTYWIAINHIQNEREISTEHGAYLGYQIEEFVTVKQEDPV